MVALSALGTEGNAGELCLQGGNGGHNFKARFAAGPLRKKRHTMMGSGGHCILDGQKEWDSRGGKNWYGTDGGFPDREFYQFEVMVDGRLWRVPQRLWQNCYEPNFRRDHFRVWLSSDGKRLTIKMSKASDGAGSYSVTWYLRRNGRHNRKVDQEC